MATTRIRTTATTEVDGLGAAANQAKVSAARTPIHVAIGILARNEADRIEALLRDVARQTLLDSQGMVIRIYVVANGCSDATARVAREVFKGERFGGVETAVYEIAQAGKANAWNEFVHEVLPGETDFVFFLDADIRIPQDSDLLLILRSLRDSPLAVVAVDRSVKDLQLEETKGLVEWLIKKGTGTANDTRTAIAGALYCVRYSEIAGIWMPLGLPGEDGFLRAMLLTSSFSHEEQLQRHLFVEGAYHVFESMRDAKSVFRHNVRLAIGTAINILLFGELRRVRAEGHDVAAYVRSRNLASATWVDDLVKQRLEMSYFPLQPRFLLRRLQQPRSWRSVKAFTLALFGTAFDLTVFMRATSLMRRGAGAGYW